MTRSRLTYLALLLVCGFTFASIFGVMWVKALFAEPAAEQVPSLAARLRARQILAVFAHPDDEIIAAGFLADAARQGIIVRTITATKGEAGKMDPPICRPGDLGVIREAELRKFGFFLGITQQEVWDYPDSKLSDVSYPELVRRLVGRIRDLRPDVVLTFEPATGFTMNPDHMIIGRAATEAFHQSENAAFDSETGKTFAPTALVYVLAPRKAMRRLGGERGQEISKLQRSPQFAMRVDPHIELTGWRIHESQAAYLRRQWRIPPAVLYRLMDNEYFSVER